MLRLPIAFNDCSCSLFVCVFWLPGANEYITFVQATRSTTDWRKRCMLIDFFLHIICMHRIWGVNGENLCSCSTWKSTYIILHQRQRLILNRFPALIALAGFVSLMNSMIFVLYVAKTACARRVAVREVKILPFRSSRQRQNGSMTKLPEIRRFALHAWHGFLFFSSRLLNDDGTQSGSGCQQSSTGMPG